MKNFTVNTKVIQIGNSLGFILPKLLCEDFGIRKGAKFYIVYTDKGLLIPKKKKKRSISK